VLAPIAAAQGAPSASSIYEGFKAQRQELRNQLNDLEGTRSAIAVNSKTCRPALRNKAAGDPLTDIDSRITER